MILPAYKKQKGRMDMEKGNRTTTEKAVIQTTMETSGGNAAPAKTPKEKPVNNPHDKGYKLDLKKPKEFLHFLRKYVNAPWTKNLKESQLRLCDKEFISKDYEGREADLVYEVTLDGRDKLYVFILQELQSTVDHTMIFRVMMYIMNILLQYFQNTPKKQREQAGFRLPSVVPIVFYNGSDTWTAVRSLRDYQSGGTLFGDHVLNLEYYLVDLNEVEEKYILSSNTVIDNIMYCDKFRQKEELAAAVRTAYQRVSQLGRQETVEFESWVKNILLSICGNKESIVMEILNWAGKGDDDMAFQYNIIRMFENERAEGVAEGRTCNTIVLIRKKIQKGKDAATISDELEEDFETIQPLYDLIRQYPEESDEDILARYKECYKTGTPMLPAAEDD